MIFQAPSASKYQRRHSVAPLNKRAEAGHEGFVRTDIQLFEELVVKQPQRVEMAEPGEPGRVLIVDDDVYISDLIQEVMQVWGIEANSVNSPAEIFQECEQNCYDLVLLDVFLDKVSGLDIIPSIKDRLPSVKIIIMTGRADKETAIRSLRLGAFDFLEKPFEMEILEHIVRRALDVQKAERKRIKLLEELRQSEGELLEHKNRLELLNLRLLETNKALTVFAQNIDREREETQRRILFKLKSVVAPAIQKLQHNRAIMTQGIELDILITQMIEELTSGLSTDGKVASVLSPSEFRIATLIKNGLTTEEIADQVGVSPSTVRTHRKNIRRKLNINSTQYNLKNYLLSGYERADSY